MKDIAFVDIQIYCHRMVTIKNYILIGDVHKSIALLRYQEDMCVLSYVTRDSHQLDVFATDFLLINHIYNLLQLIQIEICIFMLMYQHKKKLKVDNDY